MPIERERTVEEARFYNPLEDFTQDAVEIEIREDPLTGEQVRIVPDVFPRPEDGERPDISAFVEDDEGCFFCPDVVEEATPEYPDFVGVDRGSVGEATSFPNLFPYGKHSNVVVLTEDHFTPVGEFTTDLLADGLACALEYVHAVRDHEEASVGSINMNLLPSAGSSVVHPHLQTIVDDHGTNETRRRVDEERAYHDEHGRTYWAALLEDERDGDRYVGSTGDVEWLAPFAPIGQWHLRGVTDVIEVPEPDDDVVEDIAAGLETVFTYYDSLSLNAQNFSVHVNEGAASPLVVDVVARPAFDDQYVTDAFFMQTIHDERVVDAIPEEYALEAGEFF